VECRRAADLTRQRQHHSKGAFTLLELLVVISIIALLAALLLPALTSARQHAHSANCISNLHQIGIALQIYVQENGYYPLATAGDGLGEWQRSLRTVTQDNVLYCPQLKPASDEFLQIFPTNNLIFPHYGYNATGAVRRNPPPHNPGLGGDFVWSGASGGNYVAAKENWVRNPAQMIALGDSPTFVRPPLASSTLSPADPLYIAFPYILQPSGYYGVANYHANGANMLFCDDHVQFAAQSFWLGASDASKCVWNADNQSHLEFQ
jgi:prepilin-type N-terminal cleavage/methylation domain-containing protein/prepilin-type processing-associated H-X9-DG protein